MWRRRWLAILRTFITLFGSLSLFLSVILFLICLCGFNWVVVKLLMLFSLCGEVLLLLLLVICVCGLLCSLFSVVWLTSIWWLTAVSLTLRRLVWFKLLLCIVYGVFYEVWCCDIFLSNNFYELNLKFYFNFSRSGSSSFFRFSILRASFCARILFLFFYFVWLVLCVVCVFLDWMLLFFLVIVYLVVYLIFASAFLCAIFSIY